MLHSNSLVRAMSASFSPSPHISTTDSRLLVDCTCAFHPPTTLQVIPLAKTASPKLTFVCSSQRVLPIEDLQLGLGGDGDPSNASVEFSDYLNNGNGVVGGGDSLSDDVLKERIRRMRIGLANKGKVPWNKGRKHSAETRERIRRRTIEALRDPKIRKKMAEHPNSHSDQTKAKISDSLRRVWHERLKSKRLVEQFLLSWAQSIANAAKKGGSGEEELDWDSYNKIKQQLEELHQLLQAERKGKEKLMAVTGAKNIIQQTWRESIAKAAKQGGSGEQELDWDSYEKIQEEMVRLRQLQRTTEKAKEKEMARVKAEKEAQIKAIKRVILTQKRKDHQEKARVKGNIKSHPCRSVKEGKGSLEVTQEFKLHTKLTKIHISKNVNGEVPREGDVFKSIFPTHNKLDLELIKREKMQKEVSLADQIQAARDKKGKLH